MIKKIAIVVAALVAAVLLYAVTRPDMLHVERSATIQAPPERIHPLINDFHRWIEWSPYDKRDPAMKRTFSGPPSGQGAVYEWDGNSEVGQGRMEITAADPSTISIKLDFIEPFEGHNVAEFTLIPKGSVTDVTWSMHGPSGYMGKLIGVFMDMDDMIGTDFATGLANLKRIAES